MGRIAKLFEAREALIPISKPETWLAELVFGRPTTSGVRVSEEGALALPAVWSAVSRISSTAGSLPLHVYRRAAGGKERAEQHPAYSLLHDSPNLFMTAMQFRQALVGHVLLWGNAYALIERDQAGQLMGLWPLSPADTKAYWVRVDGQKRVVYRTMVDGKPEQLMDYQVLHIAGLGFDGLQGYSVIQMEREAVGLGLAMQEMMGRVTANNAVPPVILQHPKNIDFETQKKIVEMFQGQSGGDRRGRTGIIVDGMTVTKLDMPLKDAEFLAQRNYTVQDVARMFNIPASMLEAADKAPTYASAEQFNLWYMQHTVRPWLVLIEQAIRLRLFVGLEQRRYFAEHNLDGLLRGDTAARSQFYKDMWDRGIYSINDIRSLENQNGVGPDGDKRFVPLNMVPLDQAGKPPADSGTQRSLDPVYRDAFSRVLRRARADIMRELEKRARAGDLAGLVPWLDGFLADHEAFAERNLRPVYEAEGSPDQAMQAARRHRTTLESDIKTAISEAKLGENDPVLVISEAFSQWLENPEEVF